VRLGFALLLLGLGLLGNAPTARSAPPPVPPDSSLTTAQYVQHGLPSLDHTWNGRELARAVADLRKLVESSPSALPRYQSPRSGALFARLTSTVDPLPRTDLAGTSRVLRELTEILAPGKLLDLYVAGFQAGTVGASDLVEVYGATLRWQAQALARVGELRAQAANDPSLARIVENVTQMSDIMLLGAVASLGETQAYRSAERRQFVGHLRATLPVLLPALQPKDQTRTLQTLRRLDADPAMNDLDPDLHRLAEECERVAEAVAPTAD